MENVVGGSGNDNLIGDENENHLEGGAGDDILDGKGAFDILDGGDDRDVCHNGEELIRCEELDIQALSILPNSDKGGIDYTLAIAGLPAKERFTITFSWATGEALDDILSEAFRVSIPAETVTDTDGLTIHLPSRFLQGFSGHATYLAMHVDALDTNLEDDETNNLTWMPIAFDLSAQNAEWDAGGVLFEVVVDGPPVTVDLLATVQLTWGKGNSPISSPFHSEPVTRSRSLGAGHLEPVTWSRSLGARTRWSSASTASPNALPKRPADAPQLLIEVDPLGVLPESDEDNNTHPRPVRVVNVVTHGFGSILPGFQESWRLLGQEIAGIPEPGSDLDGSVIVHQPQWESTKGWAGGLVAFVYSVLYDRAAALNDSLNIPLKAAFPWAVPVLRQLSEVANAYGRKFMAEGRVHAENAALQIVGQIDSDPQLSQVGAEVIHLIGHSRGGAVNARAAEMLVQKGYFIDQFTSLDGYSVDWPGGSDVLADFDIAGKVAAAGNMIGRSVNYRVEEGLDEVLINMAPATFRLLLAHVDKLGLLGPDAVGFSPELGELLRSAGIGFKAPFRDGFYNETITGSSSAPSNNINLVKLDDGVVSGYYLPPRYLHKNFLGDNRDVRAPRTQGVSPTGEPAVPLLSQFHDPSFSELGALQEELAGLVLEESGDPLIQAWTTIMQHPASALSSVWNIGGDASLVSRDGYYGLQLSQAGLAQDEISSATQTRQMENTVGHFVFDVDVANAGTDDQLQVVYDGRVLHSIDIPELDQARVAVPIYDIAGTFGELGFRLAGPLGEVGVAIVDNLQITPYAHNPLEPSDINADDRVNILDLVAIVGSVHSEGYRDIVVEDPPAEAPRLFLDALANERVDGKYPDRAANSKRFRIGSSSQGLFESGFCFQVALAKAVRDQPPHSGHDTRFGRGPLLSL